MVRVVRKVIVHTGLYIAAAVGSVIIFVLVAFYSMFVPAPIHNQPAQVSYPENLSTSTWGIFDPSTGVVLAGNNTSTREPIASVTKLFTAEAVVRSLRKNEEFPVALSDVLTEGRAGKLSYGDTVTPYSLLFPLLIESSNDAAVAINRYLGTEYTDAVSSLTSTLALSNTEIHEPTGLSPKNVSTVEDLTRFFVYLRGSHPHIIDITRLYEYIGLKTGYVNSDPARKLKNFTGGKQGYTDEAGRTFIGTFTLEEGGGEIGIVVLGSTNLMSDIESLLAYGAKVRNTSGIMAE